MPYQIVRYVKNEKHRAHRCFPCVLAHRLGLVPRCHRLRLYVVEGTPDPRRLKANEKPASQEAGFFFSF